MTQSPNTYKDVLKKHNELPQEIKNYFSPVPDLISKYPFEISLAYLFSMVELAHNMTVYCGIVKLHRAHAEVTKSVVNSHHITRKEFQDLFKSIFGKEIKKEIHDLIKKAENIRDKTMHGKVVSQKEYREAIVNIFEYAEKFNIFVKALAGFQPFADLRGFKGRAKPLDKSTTRWLLKGIGF